MLSYSYFILLISLASQVQPRLQTVPFSNGEEDLVLQTVKSQVNSSIKPDVGEMTNVVFTVKCPGRSGGEYYTITKTKYSLYRCSCKVTSFRVVLHWLSAKTVEVGDWTSIAEVAWQIPDVLLRQSSVHNHDCPATCLNKKTAGHMFCLNSLQLNKKDKPGFFGAACYEDKKNSSKEYDGAPEDICLSWRYPGSEVPKLELPESARSPKVELVYYNPPQLEARAHAKFEDSKHNPANLPKNKVERTGFQGMGGLDKPGVNPVLYLVVLRKTKADDELLLEKDATSFSLPQFHPGNLTVPKEFIKEKVKEVMEMVGCSTSAQKAFEDRKRLYKGYIAGNHNTDNAWTEGKIVQVRITDISCSQKPLMKDAYIWTKVKNTNTGTVNEMIKPLMK